MPGKFHFQPKALPESTIALRHEVRAFLAKNQPTDVLPDSDFSHGYSEAFSRALGGQGWIGMTWPKKYGGGERSFLDRYVVTEELLAAGMPVGGHWIADRQTGPLLLRFGTKAQCEQFLPPITRGEIFFSIGMSEPDSGSDLASVRTSAKAVDGGFIVNGTKVWTSGAHRNHYMIALVRTEAGSERHKGLSQLIIDLKADDCQIRPIRNIAGNADFNEVVFENCLVPTTRLVGELGNGWQQVTSELAYERSGPERFLSSFRVLVELIRAVGPAPDRRQAVLVGQLMANLMTLRSMSVSVAGMLEQGENPMLEAALVKELGNNFEQQLPELVRLVAPEAITDTFHQTITMTFLNKPSFSLRGGTREILRGIIARGLGLR